MSKFPALLIGCIAALVSYEVGACSLERTMQRFVPDSAEFERRHSFPIALTVPTPVVRVIAFERASSVTDGDCSSYASVTLEVAVPAGSPFELSELGFLFRSEPGKPQDPIMAFPNFPVVPRSLSGNVARFTFLLADPAESRGQPFHLALDVTAINHGLQLSHSTTFLLPPR